MEELGTIILKNLPISTRNYQIVDTATGKPIENNSYSVKIAPHVIENLYELKKINEEKKQQAKFREQYADHTLTDAYTPTDDSAFAFQNGNEYIRADDIQKHSNDSYGNDIIAQPEYKAETMQSNSILGRVSARSQDPHEKEITLEEKAPEVDYITADTYTPTGNYEYAMPDNSMDNSMFGGSEYSTNDNSTFNPDNVSNYDNGGNNMETEERIKTKKEKKEKKKRRPDYINLTKDEVNSGRGVAWLAYILFFIPLIFKGKNRFVRIHANEGLDLNIAELIGGLLILPFFLISNPTGITEIVVYVAGILGLVVLSACALTIIPVMIGALCGAQFQIPWLLKKRIIKIEE